MSNGILLFFSYRKLIIKRNSFTEFRLLLEKKGIYLTADLATSDDDTFVEEECSVTQDKKHVAWWMFTFLVDTVFITHVEVNYRSISSYQLI